VRSEIGINSIAVHIWTMLCVLSNTVLTFNIFLHYSQLPHYVGTMPNIASVFITF